MDDGDRGCPTSVTDWPLDLRNFTGIAFRALERRHLARLFVDEGLRQRWIRRPRPTGTPAPALWLFFVGTGILLPIIFS